VAETQTPNYKWVKPDIGGDASTWGNVLNATTDAIDSTVYANQQAGVPIGAVTMFAGATPPSNWLICDGSSLATTGTYAGLFAAIGYAYGGSAGNFNLPNLQGSFPLGAGASNALGSSGGTSSVSIAIGNLPVHAHPITDVVHSHVGSQSPHSHAIVTGSHSHSISTGSHSHAIPYDLVNPSASGLTSGGASFGLASGQRTDTAGDLGGSTSTQGSLGGSTDTQQPGVGVAASGTGLSATQNVGSGTPLSITPPFIALNFIIRFA
jgi:microcystin-dependent protein